MSRAPRWSEKFHFLQALSGFTYFPYGSEFPNGPEQYLLFSRNLWKQVSEMTTIINNEHFLDKRSRCSTLIKRSLNRLYTSMFLSQTYRSMCIEILTSHLMSNFQYYNLTDLSFPTETFHNMRYLGLQKLGYNY